MSWKAGDMALIEGCKTHPYWNGKIVTVLSFPYEEMSTRFGSMQTYVDIDAVEGANANICILRKPYDGHDKCSWSDVVWEPDCIGVPV